MSDYHAFLRHMLETPEDEVARLVFADWLEEQDQSLRAEFIRLSVQWANASNDFEKKAIAERRDQLLTQHWEAVSGGLPPGRAGRYRFDLGLPVRVDLTGVEAIEFAKAIFNAYPIPQLGLRRFHLQAHEISISSWLRHVQEIHFPYEHQFRGYAVATMLGSPYLMNLRRLDLRGLGETGVLCEALAGQARMYRLRSINLSGAGVHGFALRSLCECPSLVNVEELDLSNNPITDSGGVTLTRCRLFKRLKALNLSRPDHLSKPMRKRLRRHFGDKLIL